MSKIRILSKKSFALGKGATKNSNVIDEFVTVPGAIQEIDESLMSSPMFIMAVNAGEIVVMNEEKKIPVEVNKEEEVKDEDLSIDEYKEKLKALDRDLVEAEAHKYGAEFDKMDNLKNNKKRVFEAYKIFYENKYSSKE